MKFKYKHLLLFTASCMIINPTVNSLAFSFTFNNDTNNENTKSFNTFNNEGVSTNNSVDTSDVQVKDNEITIKNYGCGEKINTLLSKSEHYLNKYKQSNNLSYLNLSIRFFADIAEVATENDEYFFESKQPVDIVFESIRDEIYSIDNIDTKSSMLVDFAKNILFSWRSNKQSYSFAEYFLIDGLVDYNRHASNSCSVIQGELDRLADSYKYLVNTDEPDNNSEQLPTLPTLPGTDYIPMEPEDTLDSGDIYNPELEESYNPNNNKPIEEEYSYISDYKRVGNTCVLVESSYKDGVLVSMSEKNLPKGEYVHCGIYDYIFDDIAINNNQNVDFGDGFIIDEEYINEDQNKESNNYIYYTTSKNSFTPYYYNSGIRTTHEGTASYNQLRDVLYQVVVKTKSFSIDTNDKSLAIIEGKPIVLYSNNDIYDKDYIESIFKDFKNVDLKVQEDEESSSSELEKMINENKLITIKLDDSEIQIDNLKTKNSFIVAPIETIFAYFEYEFELIDSKIILKNENNEIKIDLTNNKCYINNTVLEMDLNIELIDGLHYLDISNLFEILGFNIHWDSDENCFVTEQK